MIPGGPLLAKSYSVHPDGSLSYLTPLQLSRHELYEMISFAAVFGMQERERNITRALTDYAADLDEIETETRSSTRGPPAPDAGRAQLAEQPREPAAD